MVAGEEEEAEVLVVVVVVCSNDGPLEAWGCYAINFGEVQGRKITG